MRIDELKRVQQIYARAENAWLAEAQKPDAEPTFLKYLRGQADLAKRDYEQAWKVYHGQTAKQSAK